MKNLFFILMIIFSACNAGEDKNILPEQSTTVIEEKIDGEKLFKSSCGNCHKLDKDYTGPCLKGALQRWGNDKKAMYDFIKGPAASNNAYAKKLREKWKASGVMVAFRYNDKELDAIMSYCDYNYSTKK